MVTSKHLTRRPRLAALALAGTLAWPAAASAQLDPLLMLKRTEPNVLVVVDTSNRMQKDADGIYYDPNTYTKTGAVWEFSPGLNVQNSVLTYRRKYLGLTNTDAGAGSDKFSALEIVAVGDKDPSYGSFWATTRLAVARTAIARAVADNQDVAQFGLIKMRQNSPTWGTEKNEGPVAIDPANVLQQAPTENNNGKWSITRPTVNGANGNLSGVQAPLVVPGSANGNTNVLSILSAGIGDPGSLIPAGADSKTVTDAPVEYMLDDALQAATDLIAADNGASPECRNTIVVLVTGGGEGNSVGGANPASKASQFLNVSGRRVPIYVVAIAPPAADVPQLQAIATNSGGQYFEITSAMINATIAGNPVPELTRAVNTAVQHAFEEFDDFNTAPSLTLPFGPLSEFQTTSPIIGTVNLDGAFYLDGTAITDGAITNPLTGADVPQRSNLLVTTGFSLPGFDGTMRGFRVYKPVLDSTRPSGYKFESDGGRLWVATVPDPALRNIYTVDPNGTMYAFDSSNAAVLAPYMNTTPAEAARIIDYVRDQPLGPFVGSTPAIMDAPSVDPPPDADYPGFAATNEDRRTIVWVGGNRGMMHGIDARLGVEVWAFVPFNLLPKLVTLLDGHAVGDFDYFVDSSPKVADVRVSSPCANGEASCWRTYMMFGEGPGGTFYQTFDVTFDDMGTFVSPTSNNVNDVLSYFADPTHVTFKWAFPSYRDFDVTLAPYGDVSAMAPDLEKTVGQTWSDPAIGQIDNAAGPYTVLTGSGFLPYSTQLRANRGGIVAGTTFYLLNVETGAIYDSRNVGNDGLAETVDNCAVNPPKHCEEIKNALQADPVATGPPDSRYVSKAYVGDLDGSIWRFDIELVNDVPTMVNVPTDIFDAGANQPVFASMATVTVGASQQYVFFATGSDLLPTYGLGVIREGFKMYAVLDTGPTGTDTFEIQLPRLANGTEDEKPTAFPAVAGDIVFFTTTTFKPSIPCTAPDANLYALTFIGGPAYDNTGDDTITGADTPKVATVAGARATAPFIVDQHVAFGTGSGVELFGDSEDYNNGVGQVGVRILSWREVR